jgi:hypothetical protein
MRMKLIARLRGGRDGQRGGGPGALSLYQHDMCAVKTARGWEARMRFGVGEGRKYGWDFEGPWDMGTQHLTVMQSARTDSKLALGKTEAEVSSTHYGSDRKDTAD